MSLGKWNGVERLERASSFSSICAWCPLHSESMTSIATHIKLYWSGVYFLWYVDLPLFIRLDGDRMENIPHNQQKQNSSSCFKVTLETLWNKDLFLNHCCVLHANRHIQKWLSRGNIYFRNKRKLLFQLFFFSTHHDISINIPAWEFFLKCLHLEFQNKNTVFDLRLIIY